MELKRMIILYVGLCLNAIMIMSCSGNSLATDTGSDAIHWEDTMWSEAATDYHHQFQPYYVPVMFSIEEEFRTPDSTASQ